MTASGQKRTPGLSLVNVRNKQFAEIAPHRLASGSGHVGFACTRQHIVPAIQHVL